jgi:PTH2 family peptidyl-tRNA hydrolase
MVFSPSLILKKVLVVRTDLEMTKGKIAAQCCHAAVALVEPVYPHETPNNKLILSQAESYDLWNRNGCTKIALKTVGEQGLRDIYREAKRAGLESEYIRDAGRTQIAAGSMTVCAVFGEVDAVNEITGKLKLL